MLTDTMSVNIKIPELWELFWKCFIGMELCKASLGSSY